MKLLVNYLDDSTNIKIWELQKCTCVVQEYKNGSRSKKATVKIRYYNGKPYINCKGHRYYLEDFKEVEL